jgi:hypothetical protein
MRTGWMGMSLCLWCLALPAVVGVAATAQTGLPSILDRVQKEGDPELSELIRLAIANRKGMNQTEALEVVRQVTEGYAQIRLLDQQIAQIARRAESSAGPAEMRYELVLAKAELEAKRTAELANLREVMGVIPRFPFERKSEETLNAWLHLNVIGPRVYVTDTLRPFLQDWADWRFRAVGLLSEEETLDCIRERFANKSNLPIRIDIRYTAAATGMAERLREETVAMAIAANAQMETEVRSVLMNWVGNGTSTYYLRSGEMRTLYPRSIRRPDRAPRRLATGLIEPNDLEQHILWRLTYPGNVPLVFRIEHDQASTELARHVAETANAIVKRLHSEELVKVVQVPVEPVPDATFVGRWQATVKGQIQTIDIQSDGVCLLTASREPDAVKPGATLSCPWVPLTKEIILDVEMGQQVIKMDFLDVFRGRIDTDGNLVIDRVAIYPQGTIIPREAAPMLFKKAN